MSTAFLPDRFRPRPPRRRASRPWLALVALAAIPLVIPWWRVQAIEVYGFPGMPVTGSNPISSPTPSTRLACTPRISAPARIGPNSRLVRLTGVSSSLSK